MSPLLYVGMITDSDHSEGNVPELNSLLKYSVRKCTTQGAEYLKNSPLNPSGPAALLFFKALIASCTYTVLMTPSRVSQVSICLELLCNSQL